jgi:hypothetical protein
MGEFVALFMLLFLLGIVGFIVVLVYLAVRLVWGVVQLLFAPIGWLLSGSAPRCSGAPARAGNERHTCSNSACRCLNLPQARYCANCGAALRAPAMQAEIYG